MQLYVISGNALVKLVKNLHCLSKCTISCDESKQCEGLQKCLLDYPCQLPANEACCHTIPTIETITDVSAQVSQPEKIKRRLNSRPRRKIRPERRKDLEHRTTVLITTRR